MCLAYGSCQDKSDGASKRYSYVIGADGKILQVYDAVKPAEHTDEVLSFIDSL